jgi:hypothetical protein
MAKAATRTNDDPMYDAVLLDNNSIIHVHCTMVFSWFMYARAACALYIFPVCTI